MLNTNLIICNIVLFDISAYSSYHEDYTEDEE